MVTIDGRAAYVSRRQQARMPGTVDYRDPHPGNDGETSGDVKLYTREGDGDLVGNNIPISFVQNAINFPELIHSVKREADRGCPASQLGMGVGRSS